MAVLLIIVFVLGYTAIALEHPLKINKAATALITGVLCWTVFILFSSDKLHVVAYLAEHLGEVAGILFFLLGAMTIVELIDAHDGFEVITTRIQTTNKKKLVWMLAFITFFLSAILDNLATAIVLISLLRKLIPDKKERLLFAGLVVIAANAGGAWSPIGDVTTTMLWIGGQISAGTIISHLIIPSLVCLIVPTFLISLQLKGNFEKVSRIETNINYTSNAKERNMVFLLGIGCLLFVPVFKTITHLPPYMGILFGLGIMWLITELIHKGKSEEEKGLLSVNHALKKIDTPSVLFFLGILLSIAALETSGMLGNMASWMNEKISNINIVVISFGFISAIVDNVPLVAAAQGMFSMGQFPTDHSFWIFLAYCTGTGGSSLIIGSAAGVAVMGIEKIEFIWYLKKITWLAVIGYLSGAAVYLLQQYLFSW